MTTPDTSSSAHGISRVDVTHIHHYSRNPRRQQNPEYDRIKASIRAEGLDQPLVLSQEPGASDYVLHSGGNTRLSILKDLFEETGDDRFRWVDCVVKPWSQESNLLFAHLRENELRGGLPFIDKALAVFDAKALLEKELSVETLSQRQLEELFRERGFGLSHSMISKMGYAVDTLWPVMPTALAAGLGRPQVEKIRALERAAREIWDRRQLGEDTDFNAVFSALCRRHDGAEWDIQPLRDAIENEIAAESEQNRQVVYLEMEAQLSGRPFDFASHSAQGTEGAEEEQDGVSEKVGQQDQSQSADITEVVGSSFGREPVPTQTLDTDKLDGESGTKTPAPEFTQDTKTSLNSRDLRSLRAQLWECAAALAEHHGLGEAVIQLQDQGLGLLLVEVPPQELIDTLDQDMLGLVSALWWQLAASAELTVAPIDIVLHYLNKSSALYEALASHDAGLLFSSVWTPDPGHMSSLLWQQLNPPDWQVLLRMMETYRAIKRLAYDTGIELWVPSAGGGNVIQ
ncbi:MAG: ParB family protein [Pseudomonadales bacterium]|jgi:ParB family protein of integrating conjugative element (PFGI_1 class)|nr:ParB family protein [Pseudomonadales bacterium]